MQAPWWNPLIEILRRVPWVTAVCVITCAVLAATTVGHLVEAAWLSDMPARRGAPAPVRDVATPAPSPAPASPAGELGQQLIERNVFCSDCAAPVSRDAAIATGPQATTLPLQLIATSLGRDRMATIYNTSSGAQGAYGVGDRLAGAGPIEVITGTSVQFRNEAAGRSEWIELLSTQTADRSAATTAGVRNDEPPVHAEASFPQVRRIDERTFDVERSLVRELITGATAGKQIKGVRVSAVTKGGKLAGVRVSQARPDSLAAAVGLRPGDVIESIDGVTLTSPDEMLEIMARLNSAERVPVRGKRGGAALDLEYHLR